MARWFKRRKAGPARGRLLAINRADPNLPGFAIIKSTVTLGSEASNDFVIRDATVSRSHAIIRELEGGALEILDRRSTHGTYVNGRRVERAMPIAQGDEIRLGDFRIALLSPAGSVSARAVDGAAHPARRGRGVSWRTSGELIVIAFVVGFGVAQYFAYFFYHAENKLLLAQAVPLPAVQVRRAPVAAAPIASAALPKEVAKPKPTTQPDAQVAKSAPAAAPSIASANAAPAAPAPEPSPEQVAEISSAPTPAPVSRGRSMPNEMAAAVSLSNLIRGSGDHAGESAQDFTLNDLGGNAVALSQFRGKVVLLNFWATWCGACRSEMPSLERLSKDLQGNSDFALVTVSVDQQGASAVRPFLTRNAYDFPVLLDQDSRVSSAYDVRGIPATFIIGRDGRIVWNCAGSLDWSSSYLREALSKIFGLA